MCHRVTQNRHIVHVADHGGQSTGNSPRTLHRIAGSTAIRSHIASYLKTVTYIQTKLRPASGRRRKGEAETEGEGDGSGGQEGNEWYRAHNAQLVHCPHPRQHTTYQQHYTSFIRVWGQPEEEADGCKERD